MNQTNFPFSWENKTGVSNKAMTTTTKQQGDKHPSPPPPKLPLPPPPCPAGSGRFTANNKVNQDMKIPLPPCAFQQPPPPPSRSSSRRGLKTNMKNDDEDDPFFVAFKECTKTSTTGDGNKKLLDKNNHKGLFNFSCKRSCGVRDDNLVRVSQLPCKKDEDE